MDWKCLTSWRNLTSWRLFYVIAYFLTSWLCFWRYDELFWGHDVFLTSWRTCWRHDVFLTSRLIRLFHIIHGFWEMTSVLPVGDSSNVYIYMWLWRICNVLNDSTRQGVNIHTDILMGNTNTALCRHTTPRCWFDIPIPAWSYFNQNIYDIKSKWLIASGFITRSYKQMESPVFIMSINQWYFASQKQCIILIGRDSCLGGMYFIQ